MDNTNETKIEERNLIIIGSGPAGLSAALYAARADVDPLVLTGMTLHGQASITSTIDNYPGFPEGVGGQELGQLFQTHAERFGAQIEMNQATSVDFSQRPFVIAAHDKTYKANSVIISTGAKGAICGASLITSSNPLFLILNLRVEISSCGTPSL